MGEGTESRERSGGSGSGRESGSGSGSGSGLFGAAPGAGEAFFDLYGWFWCEGRLDHELKEVVRLRNARLTDCGY